MRVLHAKILRSLLSELSRLFWPRYGSYVVTAAGDAIYSIDSINLALSVALIIISNYLPSSIFWLSGQRQKSQNDARISVY